MIANQPTNQPNQTANQPENQPGQPENPPSPPENHAAGPTTTTTTTAKGRARRQAPGPRGELVFGNLREMRRDPLRFLMNSAMEYGDLVRLKFGFIDAFLVVHPDCVRHVLQENNANYGRSNFFHKKLQSVMGLGLITSEGEFWRRQRRIAQPAFHRERIAGFARIMTDTTRAMLERWQPHLDGGRPFDVAAEMIRLTLAIVSRTLFSRDMSRESDEMGHAVSALHEFFVERLWRVLDIPYSVPTPANRRMRNAIATIDRVVQQAIDDRRRSGEDPGDLFSMLMQARDAETGEAMNDRQLRDEFITVFLAGYETISTTMAWTWYYLSKYPTVARRLRAELATVLGGRVPTFDDLPQLEYTAMVIKESMRICPPAWLIVRNAIADDEIAGYHVPAGAFLLSCPYVTHRNPRFWENPEGFDPERFLPERAAAIPRFAYFPFGAGPHLCIGNSFAMMEAQLIVATMAQAVRLDLVPDYPIELMPFIAIRPRYGMLMTAHPA